MSTLAEIGDKDGWRCWLCDIPVDANVSVNDDLGPSIDRTETFAKRVKGKAVLEERLAHRSCNTKKGATKPVVAWSESLLVFDTAPIVQTIERLLAKGGREVVARCASLNDANEAAQWLGDRLTRLVPSAPLQTNIDPGGGQFLVSLVLIR